MIKRGGASGQIQDSAGSGGVDASFLGSGLRAC